VTYEPLPFVVDLAAALHPDAPKLRESGKLTGDPEAGFRDADVIVDEVYTTQTALYNRLEPHGRAEAGTSLARYLKTIPWERRIRSHLPYPLAQSNARGIMAVG
jgi:CO/xanthine dehydrogenase Mo-binding subunit